MSDDGHLHCNNCVSLNCSFWEGCPKVTCFECDVELHSCMSMDHTEVCPEITISCINSQYGCPLEIKRKHLTSHLAKCPVMISVVTRGDIIPCNHCSTPICRPLQCDHDIICLEAKVGCTNTLFGCPRKMKRRDINQHLEHCPASIIHCSFQYRRKQLKSNDICFEPTLPDEKFLFNDIDFVKSSGDQVTNHKDMTPQMDIFPIRNNFRLLSDKNINKYAKGKRVCENSTFFCSEYVRRDEYPDHCKTHLDVVLDVHCFINRCPLYSYGCPYAVSAYQPAPPGSILGFVPKFSSFVVTPPQLIKHGEQGGGNFAAQLAKKQELLMYGYEDDTFGSLDVLGQLPVEVLLHIFSYLDSLSLWSVSQVNQYFRGVCQDILAERGIVYHHWEKINGLWTFGVTTWSFSRNISYSHHWIPQMDVPSINHHMTSCETFSKTSKQDFYENKGTVLDLKDTNGRWSLIPIEQADFNRTTFSF